MKPALPRTYPEIVYRTLTNLDHMSLLVGKPHEALLCVVDDLKPEEIFAFAKVKNPAYVRLCLAGLYLACDHLGKCHQIAQENDTSEGSWWHAIMHRREGDYPNSKYWYAKVGEHPEYAKLKNILASFKSGTKPVELGWPEWNPVYFVDLCEKAAGGTPKDDAPLRELQAVEFITLFDYCYSKAIDG